MATPQAAYAEDQQTNNQAQSQTSPPPSEQKPLRIIKKEVSLSELYFEQPTETV
jgi:hypothetical protein